MKKAIMGLAAGLLIWNLWLTVTVLSKKTDTAGTQSGTTVVENTVNGYTTDITSTVEKARTKIVTIVAARDGQSLSHTGTIYQRNGDTCYILTNAEGLTADSGIKVRFDSGVERDASLVGLDAVNDLAVISTVPGFNTETIKLADSSLVKAGEYTIALGRRIQESQSGPVSFGVVSLPGELVLADSASTWIPSIFTADIRMTDELSGGPLLNLSGEMIGMISNSLTARSGASGYTAAIAANEIRLAVDQMIASGSVTRGYLGVTGRNVGSLEIYEKSSLGLSLNLTEGVLVTYVVPDSPAASAGMISGDVITAVGETPCTGLDSLRRLLYAQTPGSTSKFTVSRNGSDIVLNVVLG